MPYFEKKHKRYRAAVRYKRERFTATFQTKREAVEWENEKRKELKARAASNMPNDILLMDFCLGFLDYAQRFSKKTYKEKRRVCQRILERWETDTNVNDISPQMIHEYLLDQGQLRSANASNKDRKNLLAMWNWGKKIMGLKNNPVAAVDSLPHDVAPQDTYIEDDILSLLLAANRKNQLILLLFLETAARRNEIFNLTVQDINMEKQSVCLWTRKTKDGSREGEWLPISKRLADELKWWFDVRPLKKNIWLFPNPKTGKPYVDPRKWLSRLCKRAEVRNLGFHAFRRYVASILDDKHKASRKSIQKLLRHKKEMTTERYLYQIHSDLKDMAGMGVPEGFPNGSLETSILNHKSSKNLQISSKN
jgi:integrase